MQVEYQLNLQADLDEVAAVRASPEWLRRGLEIVVENAVYAMLEADSRQKVLRVTTRMIDSQIEIRVQDSGPGFPEEIKPKLFEEPVEKGRGSSGAGIGLVLARMIFEAYRGSINLGDPGSEGALVIMSLPLEVEGDGVGE